MAGRPQVARIGGLPVAQRPDEVPVDPLSAVLQAAVRSVIREELAELYAAIASPASEYRDRQQESQRLGVSVATLDRLCRDGMPYVYVGDSRRFRASEVDAWLSTRRSP